MPKHRYCNRITNLISVILIIASCSIPASAKYSGGAGEPNDPYQIANVTDLLTLADDANDYNQCFIMTADIDLDPNLPGGQIFTRAVIAPNIDNNNVRDDYGFFNFNGNAFTGVFNGTGHKIINLTIDAGENNFYIGLFGKASGSEIKNLKMENVSITLGNGFFLIGALAGCNSGGIITNCSSTGTIIVGDESEYAGGLIGYDCCADNSFISNCFSSVTVTGGFNTGVLGGLLGESIYGNIADCFSTGDVTGGTTAYDLGGMIGFNTSTITNCFSTGIVSGGDYSYYVGGLIGSNGGWLSHCYFLDTSGLSNGFGTPLTNSQMKQQASFIGWDFINTWTIQEGADYPKLLLKKYSGGWGTSEVPYRIANMADLLTLAADANDYNKCFIMTADIDLAPNLPGGRSFTAAVIAPDINGLYGEFGGTAFTGIFDGNNHKISNLTIDTNEEIVCYLGLFGYTSGGEIKNLRVNNVNISGESLREVGGLVGYNDNSTIINCSSTFSVKNSNASRDIGGLVGYNAGNIINCFATVDINCNGSTEGLGGLAGENEGAIRNCFSTGNIRGYSGLGGFGGLAGANLGNIDNCYSTCSLVAEIEAGGFGGLVGANYGYGGDINNSYATGNVSGGNYSWELGGLVGENSHYGNIRNSYSTGNVSAGNNSYDIGGLAGDNDDSNIISSFSTGNISGGSNSARIGGLTGMNINTIYSGTINNCYSTGDVTVGHTSSSIGGFVGYNNSDINDCYSAGVVFADNNTPHFGGLAGMNDNGNINGCYFLNVAGPNNGYGIPLTKSQMKHQASFVGWDFVGETANGPNDIWTICEGFDYPKLAWAFNGGHPLVISRCVVTADTTDSISISGFMSVTADVFDEAKNSSDANFVEVALSSEYMAPCVLTFPLNSRTWKNNRFSYSGTANGIKKSFNYNARTHKFTFTASRIDLTGLECPLTVNINIGAYAGTAGIDETIVNGKKPIPINLLMDVKNSLRVDKSKFTRSRSTGNITQIAVSGGFSVEDINDANLVTNPLDVTIGSQTFTVPAGNFKNTKGKFACSKVILSGGEIAAATFDFNKCTFTLTIKGTKITDAAGSADFKVEFSDFGESASVVLP